MLLRQLLIAALMTVPAVSHAAETGAEIVRDGLPGGVAPCGVCHGNSGAGKPGLNAPRLAGQYEAYLLAQLNAFASGTRPSPIMTPIAQRLGDEQMASLAEYFAGQQAPVPPYEAFPEEVVQRGGTIAHQGLDEPPVQACTSCHGPLGQGSPPDIPYLAGQLPDYIRNALHAFKTGKRRSDAHGTMRQVASGLSDEAIRALAAYFSNLPPPGKSEGQPLAVSEEEPHEQ